MDDRQRLENLVLALLQDTVELRHSVWAIKAYLAENDPSVLDLLTEAEGIYPQIDPNKSFYDQVEAYRTLLKTGKNPLASDS